MEPVTEKPLEAGVLLVLIGAVATGMVAMAATESGLVFSSGSLREIPVIAAPSGPDRRAPEEPGGVAVPNQELEVFELFSSVSPAERWKRVREGNPEPASGEAASDSAPTADADWEAPLEVPRPAVRPGGT